MKDYTGSPLARIVRPMFALLMVLSLMLMALPTRSVAAQASATQATAAQLATAIGAPGVASALNSDPRGLAEGTGALGRYFPVSGSSFAILSTGIASDAARPNLEGNQSTILDGSNTNEGYDLVQLQLNFEVPANINCLSFDYAFYSEEFPEFVGAGFNDAFVAQIGDANITVSSTGITAPGNFAVDSLGNPISIDTVYGIATSNTQSTYDAATPLLRARTNVISGTSVRLTLSIFDVGDPVFDSAAFIDNFQLTQETNCPVGTDVIFVPDDTTEPVRQPAEVYAVQRPTANHGVTPGSIVTTEIAVGNIGKGLANDVTVTVPFDPAEVRILDASFSSPQAWVSSLETNSLTIRTGSLDANNVVTATLRMQVIETLTPGTSLAEQLSFTWRDSDRGGSGTSNLTILAVTGAVDHRPTYSMSAEPPAAVAGESFSFSSNLFAPKEPVGVWFNQPDGSIGESVATFRAENDGTLVVNFTSSTDLAPGNYSMVFYGHWTQFTVVAPFTVLP